jgi:hypothetical protein
MMRALQKIEVALSRWENEGGAFSSIPSVACEVPQEGDSSLRTELDHMRIRLIAIENLLIVLLAQSNDEPRELGDEMANYISPRPGATAHRTTLEAAAQMRHLLKRAQHFEGWINGEVLS